MQASAAGGFTFIEMLMALAVAALVSAWAVPGMMALVERSRLTAASNHFMGLIQSSRDLAQVRQRAITLCASVDRQHCNRDRGQHLLVFEDRNRNGALDEAEPAYVQEQLFRDEAFWLVWRDFRQTEYLRWAPEGRTDSLNGTFTICNAGRQDELLRQLVLNRAGRVRVVVPWKESSATLAAARQRCAA